MAIKKTAARKTAKSAKKPGVKTAKKTGPKKGRTKPKVAFYWCSSCGGCEETVVDLEEKVLDVVAAADIVFWPCAMDFKLEDIKVLPDKSLAVTFINGAVRTSEQEEVARLLRAKSHLVVAFGMCAYQGGIPALANLKNKAAILTRAYQESPSTANPEGQLPRETTEDRGHTLTIPHFYETVYKLDDVIEVDYYLPGCPPTAELVLNAVTAILQDTLPVKGSVLAPSKSLCHACSRNATKPDRLTLTELKRIHEVACDSETCFLAQGVLCMGPATRSGCGELCIKGNMPCTGCFGPLAGTDQGAKMLASIGGIYEAETPEQVKELQDSLVDPAGTFYRYGLSASLLGRNREDKKND